MSEEDLASRVRQHNALQIGFGVLAVIAAAVMWYVTFVVARSLFSYPLELFEVDAARSISGYVAGLLLLLLVVEGLIYGRGQFDWATVAERGFIEPGKSVFTANYGAMRAGHALTFAYLLTWFFFSAPHLTVHAAKAFRSRIRVEPQIYHHAARLWELLAEKRTWVPLGDIPQTTAAAFLLRRLRLIWSKEVHGVLQVRIPAGT